MTTKAQVITGWVLHEEGKDHVLVQVYKEEEKMSNLESSESVNGRDTRILNTQRNGTCRGMEDNSVHLLLPANTFKAH